MGDYGFLAKNDNEEVQIDGNYANLSLHHKGSVTLSNYANILYTTSTPNKKGLLFHKVVTDPVYLSSTQENSGAWNKLIGYTDNPSVSVNYAFFTAPPNAVVEDYGLQVFNASGVEVFNSFERYLKMIGLYTFNQSGFGTIADPSTEQTVTVTDADNNYFGILSHNFRIVTVGSTGPPLYFYICIKVIAMIRKISSTSIGVQYAYVDQGVLPGATSAYIYSDPLQVVEVSYE